MDINTILIQTFIVAIVFCFYFMLVRESIIDIKIEYVPNNIIFECYSISLIFIVVYSVYVKSFKPIVNGLITFLIVFGFALVIALSAYITALSRRKRRIKAKNKSNRNEINTNEEAHKEEGANNSIEIEIEEESNSGLSAFMTKHQIKIFFIYGLIVLTIFSFLQKVLPLYLILPILFIAFGTSLYFGYKKDNIDNALKAFGYGIALIYLVYRFIAPTENNNTYLLIGIAGLILGFIIEYLWGGFLFKRFYENGGQLVDEKGFLLPEDQQPQPEDPNSIENDIVFSIGGGDLFIFGALGLFIGTTGLIEIFINTAFVHLAFVIGFNILNKGKKALPLVPAITCAYMMYFLDCNVFNVMQFLERMFS